jgi:hypothetical protein
LRLPYSEPLLCLLTFFCLATPGQASHLFFCIKQLSRELRRSTETENRRKYLLSIIVYLQI